MSIQVIPSRPSPSVAVGTSAGQSGSKRQDTPEAVQRGLVASEGPVQHTPQVLKELWTRGALELNRARE